MGVSSTLSSSHPHSLSPSPSSTAHAHSLSSPSSSVAHLHTAHSSSMHGPYPTLAPLYPLPLPPFMNSSSQPKLNSSSNTNTASTDPLATVPPALFFLVPLFFFVIVLLAVSHRPSPPPSNRPSNPSNHDSSNPSSLHSSTSTNPNSNLNTNTNTQLQTRRPRAVSGSYFAIAFLTLLSTLAGAVGLKADGGAYSLGEAENVIEAFLFFELGASVLYISNAYLPAPANPLKVRVYAGVLFVVLASGALLSLLSPFLSISPLLPPILFVSFTLGTFPLLLWILISFHRTPCHLPEHEDHQQGGSQRQHAFHPLERTHPRMEVSTQVGMSVPNPVSSSVSFPEKDKDKERDREKRSTMTTTSTDPPRQFDVIALAPRGSSHQSSSSPSPTLITATAPNSEFRSRTNRLLILILLSQLFLFSSFLFSLVGVIFQRTIAKEKELEPLLETIRTALVVLGVVGVMFGCLLHAYNACSSSAQPTSASPRPSHQQDPQTPPRPQLDLPSPPISLKRSKSSKSQHTRGSSSFSSPFPSLPSRNSRLRKGWFAFGSNSRVQPTTSSPLPNAMDLNKNGIELKKSSSSSSTKNKLTKPRRPLTIHVQYRFPGVGMVSPPTSPSPPGVRNPVSPISPFNANITTAHPLSPIQSPSQRGGPLSYHHHGGLMEGGIGGAAQARPRPFRGRALTHHGYPHCFPHLFHSHSHSHQQQQNPKHATAQHDPTNTSEDFTDLRDPFAPPAPPRRCSMVSSPASAGQSPANSSSNLTSVHEMMMYGGSSSQVELLSGSTSNLSSGASMSLVGNNNNGNMDGNMSGGVGGGTPGRLNRMSAWGRLPLPLPLPTSSSALPTPQPTPPHPMSGVRGMKGTKGVVRPSQRGRSSAFGGGGRVGIGGFGRGRGGPQLGGMNEDDSEGVEMGVMEGEGVEEALLAQRLLRRLTISARREGRSGGGSGGGSGGWIDWMNTP